ncbi:hypothetical protein AVBRAN9333_08570 [Campylobacter sp. RM9333]|uniref:hypothetical protein n=1 Tax=Campylobacter sp. RM9333 TaxID=2735731 RepID=UPI001DD6F9F7|nr:hypothetical protein [Campylobacter sp. RM9333]
MLQKIQNSNSLLVASYYGIIKSTILKHFTRNSDELIEGIHYFYEYERTKGGVQKVIKWTLEGVYMLGFFIKSAKAKEYRKKVARLLREQSEEKLKSLNNSITTLERRNKRVALGYKSQLAQQKEKYELKLKVLECELEHKSKIDYDKPSQELKKALAERGWLLMNKDNFNVLGENIATRICISLRDILGTNYPPCLKQLIDVSFMETRNYFNKRISTNQGLPFTAESYKIKRADSSYTPIYGKWVIEDGKQIAGWELELRWKGYKKLSYRG